MADWDDIWADQAQFNRQFRPDPETFAEKSEVTSELVLATTDELHELLRTTHWKKHRRPRRYETNLAHTTEELVDAFKDFITLCQVWGVTPDDLMKGYWAKSAVNRQRYSEEWVKNHINMPVILLDLDNVLCDYIRGFGEWLLHQVARSPVLAERYFNRLADRVEARQWLDESMFEEEVFRQWYRDVKHSFRCSGAKRALPAMEGAADFVRWCKERAMVILLTARPIDAYPNMLTDTVFWLNANEIEVDHIWWGADKGKVVELENIQAHVLFAVDDVQAHIKEYTMVGVDSYWLCGQSRPHDRPAAVTTLDEIIQIEESKQREG